MQPEFSVILPTRGLCPFLPGTLASVLQGGPPEMEVLLVHDRRAGEPGLDPPLTADSRVRVLHSTTPGVSSARNLAMDQARGRFVAFIDDDDLWLAGHLESAARLLDGDAAAAIAGSNAYLLEGRGAAVPAHDALDMLPRLFPDRESGPVSLHDLLLVNWFLASAVVLRRDALTPADRFDPGLAYMEDYELWLRLAPRGAVFDSRPQVVIRRHDANASRNRRGMAEGSLNVLERFLANGPAAGALDEDEWRRREGRLWHDLAYACLVEDDVDCARRAAAEAIRRLPAMPKNYAYYLACSLPGILRHALVHRGRRSLEAS